MIRHILADGREVESVEGLIVPTTGRTEVIYRIVSNISRSCQETIRKEEVQK